MTTKLQVLRDMSASLGFVREIEQIPAEYDCPVHETPIIEHHVETISGWQATLMCPAHQGDCSYGPDSDPMQIEPPEGKGPDVDKAKAAKATKPANQGGF